MIEAQKSQEQKSYSIISKREVEVLYLIAHEYSNKQIAQMLFISVNTVDAHRKNLFIKLDVRNAAGLIRRSYELGLFPMSCPDFVYGIPAELAKITDLR